MNIKPLGDRVVLKAIQEEENKAGIVIAQTEEKEQPEQGEVIAVGPGFYNNAGELVELSVKVGDKVVFSKYGPSEVSLDGQDYLIVKQDDILGIIE